jgi:hypothetical protein
MARKNLATARAGNYSAPIEPVDDTALSNTLTGTKMDKTESAYVAQAKNKSTAAQAVQKARKANKQPPASDTD